MFLSWHISGVICGYGIFSLLPRASLSGAYPQLRISKQPDTIKNWGVEGIRKYLIASSNFDDTVEFIEKSRSWTKVRRGDKYWHDFFILVTYPVDNIRYYKTLHTTVFAVTNFDADIIINYAQKQNVDAVATDKDPELQGKLKKLGIEFIHIAFVTNDDKMPRKIHNFIVPFPTYEYAPQLGYSDQGLATQQDSPWNNDDCSWTIVEIDKRLPLPMLICSNTEHSWQQSQNDYWSWMFCSCCKPLTSV